MQFTPTMALGVVAGMTVAAYAAEWMLRGRSCKELRRLAGEWGMNYGSHDTLLLTPKVAAHFPVPGAAHIRVTNVVYGLVDQEWRYVFTVEYTVGVIEQKHRLKRVGGFTEPRDRIGIGPRKPVVLAPRDLPYFEQYRQLNPRQSIESSTALTSTV